MKANDFNVDYNGILNYVFFKCVECKSLAESFLREANDTDTDSKWREICLKDYNEYLHLYLLYEEIYRTLIG